MLRSAQSSKMKAAYVLAIYLFFSQAVGEDMDPLVPVPVPNPMGYIGNWYQVYSNKETAQILTGNETPDMEDFETCATIQYGLYNKTTYTIDLRMRPNGGDPSQSVQYTGKLFLQGTPGVSWISLDGNQQDEMLESSVIKLGPPNSDMRYSYAVLAGTNRSSLIVLARDVASFMAGPKDEVLSFLDEQGFNGDSSFQPVQTPHPDDCVYPKGFELAVPVDNFEIAKYVGDWYLAIQNKHNLDATSPNSVCNALQYEQLNATTLKMLHNFNMYPVLGSMVQMEGRAEVHEPRGVITLRSGPKMLIFYVIQLGPVVDGQYEYSVLCTKHKFFLMILARDIARFRQNYKDSVLDYVENQGFDGLTTSPVEQRQGPECDYPEGYIEYDTTTITTGGTSQVLGFQGLNLLLIILSLSCTLA